MQRVIDKIKKFDKSHVEYIRFDVVFASYILYNGYRISFISRWHWTGSWH